MAMIGESPYLILDEPSAGLDPISRKRMFSYFKSFDQKQAVIIITQRIDEAESISDKIAIMVNGSFKDMGTPSYLKSTYGYGYRLRLDLSN